MHFFEVMRLVDIQFVTSLERSVVNKESPVNKTLGGKEEPRSSSSRIQFLCLFVLPFLLLLLLLTSFPYSGQHPYVRHSDSVRRRTSVHLQGNSARVTPFGGLQGEEKLMKIFLSPLEGEK